MPPNSSPLILRQDKTNRSGANMRNEEETTDNSDIHDGTRPTDTSPFSDPFFKMCFNIAVYLTRRKYGQATSWNRYGEKMEQLTKNMLVKHEIAFRTMGERLTLTPSSICGSFESVVRQTFLEGCNFGRVVAVYAFFVTVLEYCIQNGMDNNVEELQKITAKVVAEQKDWVNKNGGWNGFLNYFTDPSEKIWRGFMVATVGLGALATLLYART